MIIHKVLVFFYLSISFLFLVVFLAQLSSGDVLWLDCDPERKYTTNSTYQSNLNRLATTLPAKASSSPTQLFAKDTAGSVPDTVYALTLCRGDVDASACAACVANAFQDGQQLCAYSVDVTIFYEPCYLRFSNQNFLAFASITNVKQHVIPSVDNVTSPAEAFNAAVAVLLYAIVDYAVRNSSVGFATGVEDFDRSNPQIYAMAQCTPELSPLDCRACLDQIVRLMPKHFGGRQGGRILGLRCNYRFELYPPFLGTALLHLPAPGPAVLTPPSGDGGGTRIKLSTILVIALAIVSSALAFTLVCSCVWSRRKPQGFPPNLPSESVQIINLPVFDLPTLRAATENFAEGNKLGKGGFGVVYKGALPNGQQIAVKRLSQGSTQGIGELKNELVLIAKLHHKNLVRLVGVCLEVQAKVVVYEYMPNKSLDTVLFDPEKSKDLDWDKRFKIICGVARGLQYVHEDSQHKVIHRDLKASNVLLDLELNPKISDFGLARLFEEGQTKDVTNRVMGTFGYMAPEYVIRGIYSTKSDVFSFGVLVLEIITGRRNCGSYNSEQSVDLLTFVWEHWTRKRILDMVDPLLSSFSEDQVVTCAHVGLLCVQDSPLDRPTMTAVNVALSTDSSSLPTPSKPAFCIGGTSGDSEPHQGEAVSANEVSLTELDPR